MEVSGRSGGFGLELLNQSNYKVWRTCMESYLVGEDLWDVVGGNNTKAPANTPDNADAEKKWRQVNAKAEFVLKRSISPGLFDHIISCKSAKEIWETLERLFNKKDEARLQILENELANATQGNLSISEYFLKIKKLCSEISLLNPEEAISEARQRRCIIRGLRSEYIPYITSIQGWSQQPSLEEFENLLSSQEMLAKQMAGITIKEREGAALFTHNKKNFQTKEKRSEHHHYSQSKEGAASGSRRDFKCYRCGKAGHTKKFCRTKLNQSNLAEFGNKNKQESNEEDWTRCFVAEKKTFNALASINFSDDWIVDSACGHHVTGDDTKFSNFNQYNGNEAIVTADNTVHPVKNEGAIVINGKNNSSITLDSVFHVPGVKKNLLSVANVVDSGNYVLFGPQDVKFLRNIEELKADVVHTGMRINDLFVLSASSSYINKMSRNENAHLWHARLGHLNFNKLKVMVQKNLVHGLPNLRDFSGENICEGCQYGKAHRLPFERSISRCKTPLELIHTDLMGPTQTPSCSGFVYMLLFVDDFSRFTWVYFVRNKYEVFSRFLEFKETVEGELGTKIKRLRSDNGGEFTSTEFLSFCRKHGIKRELSCAETPQQNGIAERKIRHLIETCKSWLHAKNLPRALWAEAMKCAAYVINRVPLSPTNMQSPFEVLFGKKPDVKHLKVFGSTCYVHVPESQRSKLDSKARKCIFVGYDERKKGWKCMDPKSEKFVVSRDVVFDEISTYYEHEKAKTLTPNSVSLEQQPLLQDTSIAIENSPNSSREQSERGSSSSNGDDEDQEDTPVEQQNQRPRRNINKPSRFRDENFVSTYSCYFAGPFDDEEPSCFDEARNIKEWELAMDEEMAALSKNETWILVPKPEGVQPISCKWVYKVKRKADGSVERFKARLVARGFSQKYGEDYEETFSPVAKMTSVRTIIALAASFGWKLWQLDVKNAFLYGELDKNIYMEQPPGYVSSSHSNYVCKLRKALYGLKQAPRAWYGKIAEYLQFCGYIASNSDQSLFVKKKGNLHIVALLYVDDMIVTGNDEHEVAKLREQLQIRFDMKNLGELNHFLGLEVENLKNGIFVHQENYAKKMIARFLPDCTKKCSTPLEANLKLRREEGSFLEDPRPYRALVGSLIYLTITRPDISFAVGLVSRYMQSPRKPHLQAAKRILKYVNNTTDLGLFYQKGADMSLFGYTDADLGGDLDDRRSTSGYAFFCGPTCISWCSKKQDSVSLSTTEAEYKASSLAAQEVVWLRRLLCDVHMEILKPTALYGDNQSAIKLASNPVCHGRTKHIELEHHFIREKVLDGAISALEVRSSDNVADIFTKSLPRGSFEKLRTMLGLKFRKITLRGSVES